MNLEKSETLNCLIKAFAGESQARNRYTFYAKQAKKEGLEQISAIFLETADNEKEHAKLFYKHIPSGHHVVNASYPFFLGKTCENLIEAANGEREEWEILYKNFANIAKDEGFNEISNLFNNIVQIEKRHSHRFETLANLLKSDSFFSRDENSQWICRKCGHVNICKIAPKECPVCTHPQGYFQLYCGNY